eukprot:SAG31_NODE_533_length_14371_cov_6.455367_8_plen_92_part_00
MASVLSCFPQHIFYNAIPKRECQMKNAAMWQLLASRTRVLTDQGQRVLQAPDGTYEHFELSHHHTPNNQKPDDVDERLWMQAMVDRPPSGE